MKVVQVGVGSQTFGKTWRKGLMEIEEVEVVGLVDSNLQFLEEARQFFGLEEAACSTVATPEFYTRVGGEMIIDSSPHSFHYKNAIDAMRSGLDVVVVKPMSDQLAAATTMVAEAERLGRKLVVAQQIRFEDSVMQLKKLIADGAIGDIAFANVATYFKRTGPVREKWYQLHPMLVECAIHHLDLIRWIFGLESASVIAEEWNMPWNDEVWGKKSAIALLEMDNGARVSFQALSTQLEGESYPGRWEVEGSKGILRLKNGNIWLNDQRIWPEQERAKAQFDIEELNAKVLQNAISYFKGEQISSLAGSDNLKTLKMVFGCIESSDTGVRVHF